MTTPEEKIAKIFGLEGEKWLKHANPWSVWTRFATLPFFILAIWSRVWIRWYSLIPIGVLIVWLIINPTLFKPPKNLDNWASKSVLGERLWTERKKRYIPKHHRIPILILTILQLIGTGFLLIGLWRLDVCTTIIGTIIIYFAKMWFLDRMVWIYTESIQKY